MLFGRAKHVVGAWSPGAPGALREALRQMKQFFWEPVDGLEKMKQFGFASGHGKPENEWELFQKII